MNISFFAYLALLYNFSITFSVGVNLKKVSTKISLVFLVFALEAAIVHFTFSLTRSIFIYI